MTSLRPKPVDADVARFGRLCDIAIEVPIVGENDPVACADRLFSDDAALSALIVSTPDGPRVLPRAHFAWKISGRFGYGRSLHARSTISSVLPSTVEAPLRGELQLATAASVVGQRSLRRRYDDLLVLTPDGPRVASVAALLDHVSHMFRHIALHDALTGLPNRLSLETHGQELQQSNRMGDLAVCYVDLDGFKGVNDTFGHRAGDEVLTAFASRLRHGMRPHDLVARLGGDEFAVVIMDVDAAHASTIAERIVGLANDPFVVEGGTVIHLSASVGIAMLSNTSIEGELSRLDVLLRDSDAAMLVAKRSGKNQLYHLPVIAGADAVSPLARDARIRRRLQHALAVGDFELHYQPTFAIETKVLQSVEALVRWTDDQLGVVSPAEFIPVAEESGQILRLGAWVLREACRQSREWAMHGRPRVIAINVSPTQLRSPAYADDLLAVVAECGVAPSDLRIEITETSALADLSAAIGQLTRLREAGFAVDLDDFGTGYSSLAMLRDLPLTSVKIDKHFVDSIESSPADEFLVRGVIQTAHALGLAVTAEGVERPAQLARLRLLGCDTVQGFLTGRPVASGAITDDWALADARSASESAVALPTAG